MTYSTLISKKSGSSKSSSNSRYHQLLRWCGERAFDGVIILDECHNAKTGTMTRAKGQKVSLSKTAQTVSILQEAFPNARVVYSSATGGSDEKEMGYMQRLGLWGSGTSYSSFSDLAMKLSRGGLSVLDMLCCDLKAKGAFVWRYYWASFQRFFKHMVMSAKVFVWLSCQEDSRVYSRCEKGDCGRQVRRDRSPEHGRQSHAAGGSASVGGAWREQ